MKKTISLLLLGMLVFFCISCGKSSNKPNKLPIDATNRVDLGNGWVTFDQEFKGEMKTFLFYRWAVGYEGYGALTEISSK